MDKSGKRYPLLRRVFPRRLRAPDDAADLGTCFGLEMSLDAPAAAPAPPARPRSRWLRRLGARPKAF